MPKDPKIDAEVHEFIVKALSSENEGKTDEQIVEELWETSCPSFPKGAYKKRLLMRFLSDFRRAQEEYVPFGDVAITQKEHEWLSKVKKVRTRKQLLCLIVWKKLHNHPSGWIKFDSEEIFSLLFSKKEYKQMQSEPRAYVDCFSNYSELRVIGSKNPIVCFSLPKELEEESEPWIIFNPENEKDVEWLKSLFDYDWESGELLKGGANVPS